jgi:hypothetical protein
MRQRYGRCLSPHASSCSVMLACCTPPFIVSYSLSSIAGCDAVPNPASARSVIAACYA